jgi:hypothetical protein
VVRVFPDLYLDRLAAVANRERLSALVLAGAPSARQRQDPLVEVFALQARRRCPTDCGAEPDITASAAASASRSAGLFAGPIENGCAVTAPDRCCWTTCVNSCVNHRGCGRG